MGNQVTKQLSQEVIQQQQILDKSEGRYNKYIEDSKKIKKKLVKAVEEERWGISLSRSSKEEIIKQLKTKRAWMKIDIDYIQSTYKKVDISEVNIDIASEVKEIEQAFAIETQQLIWATKNIGKIIETWEDIVTLKDLKELENMMDETKQKIDTVVTEIKKDDSL